VQLDPIKPKLKPPGSARLKPECDDPLSRLAFKFNLRRYNVEHFVDVDEDDDFGADGDARQVGAG
jgi:hypothetical protein